jgi:arylsulfatase A-like enzyme
MRQGRFPEMRTCRHGDWKYGWNCSNFDELYNLADDPHEMRNRIDDPACADLVKEMVRRIETFMKETAYPVATRSVFHNNRVRRYG